MHIYIYNTVIYSIIYIYAYIHMHLKANNQRIKLPFEVYHTGSQLRRKDIILSATGLCRCAIGPG